MVSDNSNSKMSPSKYVDVGVDQWVGLGCALTHAITKNITDE